MDWITRERYGDVDLKAELAGRPKPRPKVSRAVIDQRRIDLTGTADLSVAYGGLTREAKHRRLVAAIRRHGRAA